MDVTCDQLEHVLTEMMDGTVSREMEEAAASHLATCDQCRLVVDETTQVRVLAKEYARFEMSEDAKKRIRGLLAAEKG